MCSAFDNFISIYVKGHDLFVSWNLEAAHVDSTVVQFYEKLLLWVMVTYIFVKWHLIMVINFLHLFFYLFLGSYDTNLPQCVSSLSIVASKQLKTVFGKIWKKTKVKIIYFLLYKNYILSNYHHFSWFIMNWHSLVSRLARLKFVQRQKTKFIALHKRFFFFF